MQDTIINTLRKSGDAQLDNRSLARFMWVIISLTLAIIGLTLSRDLLIADTESLAVVVDVTGAFVAWMVIWIFAASFVYPSLRIEAWLDEHYPDHAVDPVNYSARRDILTSASLMSLWGLRGVVLYAVVAINAALLQMYHAIAETGFAISQADVTQLTVMNSFALGTLTALLAAVGTWFLINRFAKEPLTELETPATSTWAVVDHIDETVEDVGGEASA